MNPNDGPVSDFDAAPSSEGRLVSAAWAQFERISSQSRSVRSFDSRSVSFPGYRVLREIHRGGQGVVYQALQESTHRKLAIKVLKGGPFADRIEMARFDREVDVLCRLNHPNIVTVHDRGLSEGHAYYVMDYIAGVPLDAHVAGAELSVDEILRLFAKVCDAVNVAHLRGIIHRDLKPGNIRIDLEGEPRILDFGLAKFSQHPSSDSSAADMTLTGQFIGSLPWASPEQAEGRSDLIDIRTDVYSLGVILYQLLTTRFPYPVTGRANDVIRHITQSPPARLTTAHCRIDHELELIVLKCLAKEPEQRYQSAGDLARDIRRFLEHEPIEARPATTGYQLRQFARRHKALMASLISIFVILAAATAGTTWAMLQSRQATVQAIAVNEFMREVLTSASPRIDGADVRLVDVLSHASASASERFAGQPIQEARVRDLLGEIYNELSKWSEARIECAKALALWRDNAAANDPRTLSAEMRYAAVLVNLNQSREAGPLLTDLVPRLRQTFGPDQMITLDARRALAVATMQQGKVEDAEQMLTALRADPAVQNNDVLMCRVEENLLSAMRRRIYGKSADERAAALAQIEPVARERAARLARLYGPDALITLWGQTRLADVCIDRRKFTEASAICRGVLDRPAGQIGECHNVRTEAMYSLAAAEARLGHHQESADLFLRLIACQRGTLSPDNPGFLGYLTDALRYLDRGGRPTEGEAIARELSAAFSRLGGGHGDMTFGADLYIARFVSMQGRSDEAEPLFQTLLAHRELAQTPAMGARLRLFHAGHLTRMGRFDEAERELNAAVELIGDIREGTWQTHPDDVIQGYIALYEAWNRPDKAQEYRHLAELVQRDASRDEPQSVSSTPP